MRHCIGSVVAFVVALFVPLAGALAHEHHHVPTDYPTLQAAINASGPTDEIELNPGVYSGPGFWNLDFQGKGVTIYAAEGPGTAVIDLQGNQFANCTMEAGPYIPHLYWITFRNGAAGEGGLIRVDGAGGLFIEGCTIENMDATRGGAIFVRDGQVFINNNTFRHCAANESGGAIYLENVNGYMQSNIIKECSAALGGAMMITGANPGGELLATNNVLANNTAASGGGIYASGGNFALINCNLVYNTADADGGAIAATPAASFRIANSIIHQNNAFVSPQIASGGATMSVSFSNIQDGGGVNGNIDELPVFTNADQNDYSLPVGSGCIDAGRNEELPLHIGTDLVGNPRVADGDASGTAVTDIGAVEYPVACDADWNNVGGLNSQDFFDFLNDFFTMEADFNTDGVTNSQDFFDFLAAFFTGC